MVPKTEAELQDMMQRTTDANQPDVAFRLFQAWNAHQENTVTMATTWFEIARAARLSNHPEEAVQFYIRRMYVAVDYVPGSEDALPD